MQEERLKKVCDGFSLLNEKQQDYILGIMQALIFAKNTSQPEPKKSDPANSVPPGSGAVN
ncbi:MAG: hypothetical protein LBV17_06235 [Treponema sp.]|jgi:hypothetical protein|nr:hypothetical protein [Treponema sp.]